MPFHWNRPYTDDLYERFPAEAIGARVWRALIERLASLDPRAEDAVARYLDWFDEFIELASNDAPAGRPTCRVFVSHKQQDVAYAERIAYLATSQGLDYWLDIHDPALAFAQRAVSPNDPRLPILLAAIIEMGLLNATHVAAVLTPNSFASKWIPDEFGRAKARQIRSDQAASWLEPSVQLSDCGEYVRLGILRSAANTA